MNPPGKHARETGRSPHALRTALLLGALGLVGGTVVGYLSFRASRSLILQGFSDSSLALARSIAARVELRDDESAEEVFDEIRESWKRSDHPTPGAYLCVVRNDGTLAVHTGEPERVGDYVGHQTIEPPTPAGAETVDELLREGSDWVGINRDESREEQLVALAYSEALDSLVAVHLDNSGLERQILGGAVPSAIGMGAVALLFLVALGSLGWSYARQQEQLRDAIEELADSERRFQELYDHAPDMFLSIEVETGQILRCNRTLARTLGKPRSELIGSQVLDICDKASRREVLEALPGFLREAAVRDLELRIAPSEGEAVPVSANVAAVRDEDGSVVTARAVLRDIGALKRAEAEKEQLLRRLEHRQRIEALGTLAGGIAHDFNNILLSIAGYTELLLGEIDDGSPADSHLREVLRAADRAKALVGNILTFSRKREPLRTALRLRQIVQEGADFLRASIPPRIDIRVELGEADPWVFGDANQLHQVLINLGLNSRQAIGDDEGLIFITLEQVVAEDETPQARIVVRDSGGGMGSDVLAKIFEPYFTTRDSDEGTGLGLAVVDGIVDAHDGSVTVNSEVGVGTSVEVRLPVLEEVPEGRPDEAAERRRPGRGGGEHILVLDDEPGLTRLAERRLGSLGYDVTCANEVAEARQALERPDACFDLLISDQNLKRATGLAFIEELREEGRDLPVVLATGTPDAVTPEVQTTLRIDEVLGKPYSLDRLAEVVRQVLDAPR